MGVPQDAVIIESLQMDDVLEPVRARQHPNTTDEFFNACTFFFFFFFNFMTTQN